MHLALNARGMLHFKRMEYRKAIADFSEAIRVAPNLGVAYENRARAKQAIGDAAGARADIRKASELMASRPPN